MRVTEDTKWGDLDPSLKKLDNTGGRYTDELNTFCNNVLSWDNNVAQRKELLDNIEEESYADVRVLYKKWQIAEAKVVELENKIKRLDKDLGKLIRQLES